VRNCHFYGIGYQIETLYSFVLVQIFEEEEKRKSKYCHITHCNLQYTLCIILYIILFFKPFYYLFWVLSNKCQFYI